MKVNTKDIIFGGVIILLLFLLKCSNDSTNKVSADLFLKNYNLEVMNDSVKQYKTKNGELVSSTKSLVTKLEDLHLYNDTLFNRVTYLEDELDARPVIYIKGGMTIVHDTVYVDKYVSRVNDSTYFISFENDTTYNPGNGRYLSGDLKIITKDSTILVKDFKINKDELFFDAEIVFSVDNDTLVASVISKHPGFNAENIQPVVLDPNLLPAYKKLNSKRFAIGPYIGIGIGSNLKFSPQIGVGLTYKIITF